MQVAGKWTEGPCGGRENPGQIRSGCWHAQHLPPALPSPSLPCHLCQGVQGRHPHSSLDVSSEPRASGPPDLKGSEVALAPASVQSQAQERAGSPGLQQVFLEQLWAWGSLLHASPLH